jgi:catechol 2,3-dioxygenase-like lactoylglutathione lyase family enzyme
MKFNAGIITEKLQESKEFYTTLFGWNVIFENEFYLLLGSDEGDQISFLLPNHPSQQPVFHSPFSGKGVYITIEIDDVDAEYKRIKKTGAEIAIDLREEPWGDKHFALVDPNGIGVDIVTYSAPDGE